MADEPEKFCPYCETPLSGNDNDDYFACGIDCLRLQVDALTHQLSELQEELRRERRLREGYARDCTTHQKEIERQKEMRRTEREGLAEWLDRRIEQQEEAMGRRYISEETQGLMKVELSVLKRYREIVVEGKQRNEDPLMPRFSSD